MAAGLGFKTFTTGEVLTAGDTNGYLMQGVLVFASAAARDAAITSPQEGQFAYLKDTNVTTYYTGSAWANLDTTGMTNPMTTTGDTIYSSSGSTPARLGIGSTGQVLTVAGGVPTWATASGGGTYTAYTPTLVDITLGNGTMTARYCQIGKFVEIQVEIVFGSTTSVTGGNPSLTLPVTAVASDYGIRGMAKYGDASGEEYLGMLDQRSTTTMHPRTCQVVSSKVVNYGVSSSQPFTWTTNDQITLFYVYEAA